jgi:hypothetical protein
LITFIVLASVAAYVVVDLFAARYLYGRMRAKQIDHGHNVGDPVNSFNTYERSYFMGNAFVLALAWPLTLPLALLGPALHRFMVSTPVRSQHELKAEADALERRIRELERELKL